MIKKTFLGCLLSLLISSAILAQPVSAVSAMQCPSVADVQKVANEIKNGLYANNYYAPGDSGPVYRIYADAAPALPASILSWMFKQKAAGHHHPLLAFRILEGQTQAISWLSQPKVYVIHHGKKSMTMCQYAAAGIFDMNGVFLAPHA